MQFNLYIATLFISFLFSAFLTVIVYRRKGSVRGGNYFFVMMLAITVWSLGGVFEQAVTTVEAKKWWSVFTYTSIPLIPFVFLAFVVRLTQVSEKARELSRLAAFVLPSLIFLTALTNDLHKTLWPGITLTYSAGGVTADYGHGPAFYAVVVITYGAVALTVINLVRGINIFRGIFRKQLLILLVSQIIPIAVNSVYVFRGDLIGYVDPTPIAFTFTGLLISYGMFRYSLLELIPAARNILFDNLNEGVVVVNRDFRMIDYNRTIVKFLGKDDLEGKDVRVEFADIPELVAICTDESSMSGEFRVNNRVFRVTTININEESLASEGRLISISDVTALKKNEEILVNNRNELSELNSSKDKLFSIIAHDLKNPFFGIIGLSDMVIEDFDEMEDAEKKDLVKEINQSAKETYRMLENLLDWARQQTGSVVFDPVDLNINELISVTVESLRGQAAVKRLTLETDLAPVLMVHADENMIRTVLRNLITNAIKFSNPGGGISIGSELSQNQAMVAISDEGVGISETDASRLFRIDTTVKSLGTMGEKGTGLGLVLCHEFIQKNGGTISVRRNSGAGTTFWFTIPAIQQD